MARATKVSEVGEISIRERLPRDMLWILAGACVISSVLIVAIHGLGYDSHAYWQAWRGDSIYDRSPTEQDAYLYSPAFAQLIWPLAQLPFPLFCAIFTAAPAAAFWWLLRPLPKRFAVPFWLMTTPETVTGNVFWLLALCAVWGMRRGAWWVPVAYTKVTPLLGPVWFLVRREWSQLIRCLGLAALVGAASYSLNPEAWHAWVVFLLDNQGGSQGPIGDIIPLELRVPVAVGLVGWAATTDRQWLVPVAMVIATPVLATASFTMLAAIPRLLGGDKSQATKIVDQRPSTVTPRE